MSHVPPHRWADALAGRLDAAEARADERHAASCRPCKRARDRVRRASDSFATIKTAPPPELPWDSVRARIHWSVSTERHERLKSDAIGPARRPWLGHAVLGVAAAGALAYALVADPLPTYEIAQAPAPRPAANRAITPPAPAAPAPLAGLVNRTTGEVMIDGIRVTDLFARRIGAGTVIATGDGARLDVQFGDASAFALAPRSMLELRRFDADAIELVVEGTVDIEVAPRASHQTFIVRAGERVVEVRGTQFRVHHDARTTAVACRHGLVAVRDANGHVEVGAARRVELAPDHAVTPARMRPLSVDEVSDLAQATPMMLPMWNIDTLLVGSAPLEIATVGRRDVRVDGVELGMAPMRVRVLPGRHTVEAADHAGRFRRAGWVDVAVPAAGSKPARVDVHAEPPSSRNVNARRRQLQLGMDKARLAHCVRSIAKSGLTGTYVQIEIAVDAQGAVGFLNVIDTDLPSTTANCVREVLADVRFGAGDAATWRARVDL